MRVAVFDSKEYDRESLERVAFGRPIEWVFLDFRLTSQTVSAAKDCDAVCAFVNDKIDRDCLLQLRQLGIRLLTLRCAGFNNVDLIAARELEVNVVRVPAYSPHAVAEHTVGLLLMVNRKLHRAYNRVRELNFSLNGLIGFDLYQKTIGVVGTGRIGKVVAQILCGFGANIIAFDPDPDQKWGARFGVSYCELDGIWERSDIITLHLPLNENTFHIIDDNSLSRMKEGVYIVNTSRGKLVDTTALIANLKSGRVGGVALDVYEEEEGVFFEDRSSGILLDDELSRLLTFPNVVLTAHQAFLTREALCEIGKVTVENLLRFQSGRSFIDGSVLT